MGGTLRVYRQDNSPVEKEAAIHQIIKLLGADVSVVEFESTLKARRKAYKNWAEQTLIELNEEDLWTKWMLPDWPAEQIATFSDPAQSNIPRIH